MCDVRAWTHMCDVRVWTWDFLSIRLPYGPEGMHCRMYGTRLFLCYCPCRDSGYQQSGLASMLASGSSAGRGAVLASATAPPPHRPVGGVHTVT